MFLHGTTPRAPAIVVGVPFTYNPLHDLESIWWIATFFIFHHFTVGGHNRQLLDIDVAKLFPTIDHQSRTVALTSEGIYRAMIGHLPGEWQGHGQNLEMCRQILLDAYFFAESKPDINKAAFNVELYETFRAVFGQLHDDPGSLSACINQVQTAKKQSLADKREDVDQSVGNAESGPSAGKGKMVNKQTLTDEHVVDDGDFGNAKPRRSIRKRKILNEQNLTEDDEHFEGADFDHSTRKRQALDKGKD